MTHLFDALSLINSAGFYQQHQAAQLSQTRFHSYLNFLPWHKQNVPG